MLNFYCLFNCPIWTVRLQAACNLKNLIGRFWFCISWIRQSIQLRTNAIREFIVRAVFTWLSKVIEELVWFWFYYARWLASVFTLVQWFYDSQVKTALLPQLLLLEIPRDVPGKSHKISGIGRRGRNRVNCVTKGAGFKTGSNIGWWDANPPSWLTPGLLRTQNVHWHLPA